MDFLKIVYVNGRHLVCFSSPPFSCPSPAFSCHFLVSPVPLPPPPFFAPFSRLPSVPFLLIYTLLCFLLVHIHISLPLITFSCPSFLSFTLFSFLPLYYHSVCPSYVSFSFDCFLFVSFDISCYKYYLIFY